MNDENEDVNQFVDRMWLGHYKEHKHDWWTTALLIPGGCSGDYISTMLHVFKTHKVNWRSELTPEELDEAEEVLEDALKYFKED